MACLADAIEIPELITDRQEMFYIARSMEKNMPASMRRGRSKDVVIADLYNGGVAERDLSRFISKRDPAVGAIETCLERQHCGHIWPGPDFLDTNAKCTDLAAQGETLQGAFDRDFRLFVSYGANGLHPESMRYALVFRLHERAWFVGWATKQEVEASTTMSNGALTLPLSKLRSPVTY